MIIALYTDGGVIGSNPSAIGGTYAFRLVHDDGHCEGFSGVVTPAEMEGPVTNNQTELVAMLEGMMHLPADFAGTIYSDSAVTLGRVFQSWKWTKIPQFMHRAYQEEHARLVRWHDIAYVLLDGHPTKAQLAAGEGKRGHPVSEHNIWCDQACTDAGQEYLQAIGKNIPSTAEQAVPG